MKYFRITCLLIITHLLFTPGQASAQSNPTALVPDIQIDHVINVPAYCSRIALDPVTKDLYYTVLNGDIHRVAITQMVVADSLLYTISDHHIQFLQGLVFYDSTVYLIGDVNPDTAQKRGLIMRGQLQPDGNRTWDTVAITELYPQGHTAFDHGFSGITINLTGDSLFINSGSRTDHGEEQNNGDLFPGVREVPLTSAVFRIPSNAHNLILANDSAAMSTYLYADGLRNSFALAFAPDGKLFGAENSGDRDDPDELNWIQKGNHYGFPWILGGDFNPQQFANYNPDSDVMLSKNRYAYKKGFYHNDPDFPPIPSGLIITPGVLNLGPDADYYRDSTNGIVYQAGMSGYPLRSFTPHRAPVGLVFDSDSIFDDPYHGSAFMLGYQNQADSNGVAPDSTNGTLLDPSEDMVQLNLTYDSTDMNYKVISTRIIEGFTHPVAECVDSNAIYLIEYSKTNTASIWKITFPVFSGIPNDISGDPFSVSVFPNPSQNDVTVLYSLKNLSEVHVEVFDEMGLRVMDSGNHFGVKGKNRSTFSVQKLEEGYYVIRLSSDEGTSLCKLLVTRK